MTKVTVLVLAGCIILTGDVLAGLAYTGQWLPIIELLVSIVAFGLLLIHRVRKV